MVAASIAVAGRRSVSRALADLATAVVRRVAAIPPLSIVGAGAALALGTAAAIHPILGLATASLVVLALISIAQPAVAVCIGVLTAAFGPEYYEAFIENGSAITRAHRLLVLASLAPLVVRRGLRDRLVPVPLVAYGALLVLTYTIVSRQPGLTPVKSGFALATLTVGWLATQVRWRRHEMRRTLFLLAYLPVISVAAGLVLDRAGLHPLYMEEYTGVARLQGATIPAYLGFLGTVGSAAGGALLLLPVESGGAVRRHRRWAALAIVSSVACVGLSGTRGALIAALVVAAPVAWRAVARAGRGRRGVRVAALVLAATLGSVAVAPRLVERTKTDETSNDLDTSGRAEAWSFYLAEAEGSPELGRGLGAGPVIGEESYGRLRGDFRGTHNEYVRLYVEGGWLGLVIIVGAIALHLRRHLARTAPDVRAGLVALIAAFATYSAVDNTVSTFHFFFPFGLLVGIYSARRLA